MVPRTLSPELIHQAVLDAIGEIYCRTDADTLVLLSEARDRETDELARDMLDSILLNAQLAPADQIPSCQDTGLLVVFAELGSQVLIEGGTLEMIISAAANEAWQKYHLRDSLAPDPLRPHSGLGGSPANPDARHRASDPSSPFPPLPLSPLILHLEQVPGDQLTLHFDLKGGGAENCSALKMFSPTTPLEELEDFIVDTVVSAGGKPCPPVTVGVGIGGNFEICALLAKKALVVPQPHDRKKIAILQLEQDILDKINARGQGVQGMGGQTTALEVRILTRPCHIASLPVAVNLDCHAHRRTSRTI